VTTLTTAPRVAAVVTTLTAAPRAAAAMVRDGGWLLGAGVMQGRSIVAEMGMVRGVLARQGRGGEGGQGRL
jgi:hypothetical protein